MAKECLYFAEGVIITLVSLGALKSLNCLPRTFPQPDTESASSLTERDNEDWEEEDEEKEIRERQPTPEKPNKLPFPATEENVPKLKEWLIEQFASSSFNIPSAPLAKMLGPPMKIHIDPEAEPVATHKPIPIPLHWRDQVEKTQQRHGTGNHRKSTGGSAYSMAVQNGGGFKKFRKTKENCRPLPSQ